MPWQGYYWTAPPPSPSYSHLPSITKRRPHIFLPRQPPRVHPFHTLVFALYPFYEMQQLNLLSLTVLLCLSQNVLANIRFTMLYTNNPRIYVERPYQIVWTGAEALANITFADGNGTVFAIECMKCDARWEL
jgi:hypothetical protein